MFVIALSVAGNRHHVSPHPSLDPRPHTWKVISDSLQTQMLPSILPVAYIFSFIIMTYLKKLTGIKSLNTKQQPVCPRVYPSSYKKTAKLSGFNQLQPEFPHFIIGMVVEVLFFKKQRGNPPPAPPSNPPPKRRGYYKRVIYDCCLALCSEINEALQSKINL